MRTLVDLEPGETSTVQRVPDRDRQLLGYLSSLGLMPGASVELVSAAPFGGPLVVSIGGVEAAISVRSGGVIEWLTGVRSS